jgi:hypothetical protein
VLLKNGEDAHHSIRAHKVVVSEYPAVFAQSKMIRDIEHIPDSTDIFVVPVIADGHILLCPLHHFRGVIRRAVIGYNDLNQPVGALDLGR